MKLEDLRFAWGVVFILLGVLIFGCNVRRNKPIIEVQRSDTPQNTGVVVRFWNFDSNRGTFSVQLSTPDELKSFREQIDFLVIRLEEAENQMNTHEPLAKK